LDLTWSTIISVFQLLPSYFILLSSYAEHLIRSGSSFGTFFLWHTARQYFAFPLFLPTSLTFLKGKKVSAFVQKHPRGAFFWPKSRHKHLPLKKSNICCPRHFFHPALLISEDLALSKAVLAAWRSPDFNAIYQPFFISSF